MKYFKLLPTVNIYCYKKKKKKIEIVNSRVNIQFNNHFKLQMLISNTCGIAFDFYLILIKKLKLIGNLVLHFQTLRINIKNVINLILQ